MPRARPAPPTATSSPRSRLGSGRPLWPGSGGRSVSAGPTRLFARRSSSLALPCAPVGSSPTYAGEGTTRVRASRDRTSTGWINAPYLDARAPHIASTKPLGLFDSPHDWQKSGLMYPHQRIEPGRTSAGPATTTLRTRALSVRPQPLPQSADNAPLAGLPRRCGRSRDVHSRVRHHPHRHVMRQRSHGPPGTWALTIQVWRSTHRSPRRHCPTILSNCDGPTCTADLGCGRSRHWRKYQGASHECGGQGNSNVKELLRTRNPQGSG